MKFEPLYYGERLKVINLEGDVGIITLWSKVDSALHVIEEAGIDLSEKTSRIAVVANLYGNGLPQMLRNLLWNPQIKHIVVVGKNLSGSMEWLINFFHLGLEETEFLGIKTYKIRETNRIIDGELKPDVFQTVPKFVVFGDLGDPKTKEGLVWYLSALPDPDCILTNRIKPPVIPEPVVTRFPSEPRAHTIVRRTMLEAWKELVFRLYRFGFRTNVSKKTGDEIRIELQNTHVIVSNPVEESESDLARYGFDLVRFKDYQKRFLDPEKPLDLDYTYGNRLRGYFSHPNIGQVDSPTLVVKRLQKTPDSRHCYISLWDNSVDLVEGTKCPCFVSAFFRRFDGKLTLTATFRTHNAMDAWPENFYGLMALQKFVSEQIGIIPGPITVISHSISIDPQGLDKALRIVQEKTSDQEIDLITGKLGPRMDPNGTFTITIDSSSLEIVAEHSFEGMKINEYRGKIAQEIEYQIARDCAVSEISHALYIGRELARKEFKLKTVAK